MFHIITRSVARQMKKQDHVDKEKRKNIRLDSNENVRPGTPVMENVNERPNVSAYNIFIKKKYNEVSLRSFNIVIGIHKQPLFL